MGAKARRRVRRPSIGDVAALAGVSSQTVSRVANGATNVRPATAERVREAMARLGYQPNRAARALRNGDLGSIGLIARDFATTGESLLTQAVLDAAGSHGYSVTLLSVEDPEPDDWRLAAQRLSHQAVDGLVVVRADRSMPEPLPFPRGMPVAVADLRFVGLYPSVGSDEIGGTRDAVEHLLGLGHRTVHHIAGPDESDHARTRTATWRRTLQLAGIDAPDPWQGDWTAESGYAIGAQVVHDRSITAVYAANDDMALGLMRAAHEAGRQIPGDLSIVGFDGLRLAEFAYPALTTIQQDFRAAGRELVRLVLRQLADPSSVRPDERLQLPTRLVVRGTTGPPP